MNWRVGFFAFCLVYIAWVVYLGFDNFDKVHSEYGSARQQLQPDRIEDIAFQELADQCRKKLRRQAESTDRYRKDTEMSSGVTGDPCLSWPPAVLQERQDVVRKRLTVEKNRLKRKLIVFYISFSFFFLFLPMALLYLLLSFLIWIFRDLKFIK